MTTILDAVTWFMIWDWLLLVREILKISSGSVVHIDTAPTWRHRPNNAPRMEAGTWIL